MSPIHAIPSVDEIRRRLEATRRERSILRRLFRLSVETQHLRREFCDGLAQSAQRLEEHGAKNTEANFKECSQ
jgi:hypothetical protein